MDLAAIFQTAAAAALHHRCCYFSGMWHGWATHRMCSEPYICWFVGCPRTGSATQVIHRLRTLEADLQPLNHGLNSPWRHTQDRGQWRQLLEMAMGLMRDDDDDGFKQVRMYYHMDQ